jgi:fructokinase
MKKILCIGEALIDMICTDKGTALSKGQNFLKKPGGAPANVAAVIAALGGSVELVAKVGNDPFGVHLIETMKGFGVDTKWILQDKEHFTTMAFVSLMENGERDFVFNRGADGYLSIGDLKEINLDDYSIIHFGSATAFLPGPLQDTYSFLLDTAISKNIFTSFDPNYRQLLFGNNKESFINQSWQFLEKVNFFKLSDEEALLLTGSNNLNDAVKILTEKTTAIFAITLGEKGALLRLGDKTETVSSVNANVVDTTGAGDSFVGAVLYQLNKESSAEKRKHSAEEWVRIISNANKIAARTCEYFGAMESFKYLDRSTLS